MVVCTLCCTWFWYFQEELRSAELSLRKANQEIESLVFRNQQLTKRVEALQNGLDEVSHHSAHSSTSRHGAKEKVLWAFCCVCEKLIKIVHHGVLLARNVEKYPLCGYYCHLIRANNSQLRLKFLTVTYKNRFNLLLK